MHDLRPKRPLRILLADDGSAYSQVSARLIGDLALPPASRVFALAIVVPRDAASHAARQRSLDRVCETLNAKGIKTLAELRLGYPSEALVAAADEFEPDLIVMGAKGLRATFGILLGGVTQQVVEYADWPVLVVRKPYQQLQKVLLVTDGSPSSQFALEYLCRPDDEVDRGCAQFPLAPDADLRVMHVLPPVITAEMIGQGWAFGAEALPAWSYPTEQEDAAWQAEEEQAGQDLLQRTTDWLQANGLEPKSILVRGDAATEIIAYCQENEIDLVVAGSRGLSPVSGWLLGSVSRKLVHYAPCSVLIVKHTARL